MEGLDFSVVPEYAPLIAGRLEDGDPSPPLRLFRGCRHPVRNLVLYGPRNPVAVCLFVWLFMGTPLLLQLYLIYFGLASSDRHARPGPGIVGLGLHFAVYNADVIRAGIVAVDPGQNEGARSLGLSRAQSFRYVIIPQAVRAYAAARQQPDRAAQGLGPGLCARRRRAGPRLAAGDQRDLSALRVLHHRRRTLLPAEPAASRRGCARSNARWRLSDTMTAGEHGKATRPMIEVRDAHKSFGAI